MLWCGVKGWALICEKGTFNMAAAQHTCCILILTYTHTHAVSVSASCPISTNKQMQQPVAHNPTTCTAVAVQRRHLVHD
jgi:hypothetical protein